MADLRAAQRLKKLSAKKSLISMRNGNTPKAIALADESWDYFLAAQALEARAWQAETGAKVKQCWSGERWFCQVADGEYVADTPLGALLAAMEGEGKNG